jgi:hypothetical protein
LNALPMNEKAPGGVQSTTGLKWSLGDLDKTKTAATASQAKPITPKALGEADYFHPQTGKFIVRMGAGRWIPLNNAGFNRVLRSRGLKRKPDEGCTLSEIDRAILEVQNHNDVDYFGRLCGRNSGFIEENGNRILVTEDMQLIEPRKGQFENVLKVIRGLLAESEESPVAWKQEHTFHGWMQSSVAALRAGKLQQQQALAICGPPGCGKSYLQNRIITDGLAGRSAKAERYFSGKTDFNADLFGAEHLVLEDEHCSKRLPDRLKLGAAIKQHTVNLENSLHGKNKDARTLSGWWRVSITLNDDDEALMVLPPLDNQFADKLILLRASSFEWPMPMTTTDDRNASREIIKAELPAYLYWLLHEWEMPQDIIDPMSRYNVATYHHPEMIEALHHTSPEAELHEFLCEVFGDDLQGGAIELTYSEIEKKLRDRDHVRADRLFTFQNACSSYLGRLAKKHPRAIERARNREGRWWRIHPELIG